MIKHKIISIDESSFCVNDYKNRGYSLKGKSINRMIKHKSNKKRYSLLMTISNKKVIDYQINDTNINSEVYLNFFKKNKEVFKNKKILQDNVRFHHAKNILMKMKYIPVYTPMFNPIENSFSKIKLNYRRLNHDDIKMSINTLTEENLQNYYNHTVNIIKDTYENYYVIT